MLLKHLISGRILIKIIFKNMNNKKFLFFMVVMLLVVGALMFGNNKADAKRTNGSIVKCEYANPRPGCQWTGGEPYPKCGAILVCNKPAL
jgi:hypothetical protein